MIYIACILIVFITATVHGLGQERSDWNANPEWYITRDKWSHAVIDNPYTTEHFDPLKLVVIQDTETFPCLTFDACSEAIRKLQAEAISKREIDVPYNFLIGNDGRVYEGRGWGLQGDQNFDVNRCSLKIGFIGDYREEHRILIKVTEVQLTRTKMLLQQGVALGYLQEDYLVVGARDLLDTGSPGSNLYNAIQKWDHYDHINRYKGLTCEEIYSPEEEDKEKSSEEEEDKTSEEEDESSEEEVEESSEEEEEESSEEEHSEEDEDDDDDDDDEEVEKPDEAWFIPRETWKAQEVDNPHTTAAFDPLKLVVIHHTVTAPCFSLDDCADAMRRIQISVMNNQEIDVPYNFVIGNDGRVYEARGWGVEGAQRFDANRCSLTIGFIGNYEEQRVTEEQLERAKMIIKKGVEFGHLVEDYLVVGARDLTATVSPGANLYRAIQQWKEYDHQNRYRGMTCEQIYAGSDWFVPRVTWKAQEVNNPHTTKAFDPLKLVVIHHTVTAPCFSLNDCADAMRRIQTSVMNNQELDVPYNFVIGNDGRVYEARGWGVEGAQRFDANRCSLTIGFIGNYETQSVTQEQQERAKMIIKQGVRLGHLVADYLVVGARDLTATVSPGANLYRAIQQWKEYDHRNRYKGMTCEQIYK